MKSLLVVYYSRTGKTEAMAVAMADALRVSEPRIEVSLKRAEQATNEDLMGADGVLIGTPTYFRAPSWPVKKLIDDSIEVYRKMVGKVAGMFTSSGTFFDAVTCLKMLKEMLEEHGMMIVGKGVVAVGKPSKKELEDCKKYALRVAACVQGKVSTQETLHEGK